MKNKYFGFLGLFFLSLTIVGQTLGLNPIKGAISAGIHYDTCYVSTEVINSRIVNSNPRFKKFIELQQSSSAAARAFQNSLATSEIIINFSSSFSSNSSARAAFRFAADMWEMEVVSSVPIIIEADLAPLGAGTIAQNGSPAVRNVPNTPDPSVAYNTSLANAIAGVDLSPGESDLFQTYNSDFNFYYGLDANPGDQTDFVSIALHEIGHGMGISGTGSPNGFSSNPRSWDTFIESGAGTSIVDLGSGSPEQIAAMTSDNLFMNSFNTRAALDGIFSKVYAPNPFNQGSSLSHWDEASFPAGDPNSLMSPSFAPGEAIHDIGDITRGILRDMGWELAPKTDFDLGIATITSPVSGQNLSNNEDVTIVIGNLGVEAVSNVEVSYTINGGTLVTEIFEGTVAAGEEQFFTFSTGADLSQGGQSYRIVASVNYFIDEYADNNSTFIDLSNVLPVSDFPYEESFEEGPASWTISGSSSIWELGTPSGAILDGASDGVSAWVTRLTGNYPDNQTASVVSPAFNFDGLQDPTFAFDISYDIETGWDGAALQFSIDNGATWSTVGALGDGNNWYTDGDAREASSDGSEGNDGIDALTASVGNGDGWTGEGANGSNGYVRASHVIEGAGGEGNVFLRVIFSSDAGVNNEGFAFDNAQVLANPLVNDDIGITSINSPKSGPLTANEIIIVDVKNFGLNQQSGFDLAYQIDANPEVIETFAGVLQPGESAAYSFSQAADLSADRTYEITSTSKLTNDAFSGNDAITVSVANFATITNFPYNESFETENHMWTVPDENSSWERAEPASGRINTASDGSFAFVTNGSGDYLADETSILLSPGFNFSNLINPAISFDIWYDTEMSKDGVTLEASVDNGETWKTVGDLNDPLNLNELVNWHTESDLNFGSQSTGGGWAGNSTQYLKTFNGLSNLGGENFVLLRFLFKSDGETQSEGISIDNVSIFDKSTVDFTFNCVADTTLSNDLGEAFATFSIANPSVEGATSPTFYNDYSNTTVVENNVFFVGTTAVNFLVESAGRFAVCNIIVVVEDNEDPVIDCPEEIVIAIPAGDTSAVLNYSVPTFSDNFGFPIQATYQVSSTIDDASGVACPSGPNAYLRAFDLINDFDIASDYNIQSVDVGFQVVATSGTFDAQANIYTFDGQNLNINSSDDFIYANLEFVGTSTFTVDASLGNQLVNVPVTALVPFGMTAVLEVFTEVGSDITFPGANPNVTGGRSFLASATCGVPEPSDVRFIGSGFPNAQFVMFLNGTGKGGNVALELVEGLGSGQEFPIGDNTEAYRIVDLFGNETNCSFNLKIVESALDAPIAGNAINVLSSSFEATWTAIDGASSYEIFVSDNEFISTLSNYNGVSVAGNSVVIDGLSSNSTHQYKVRAKTESGGLSELSNTVTTSTQIDAPSLNDAVDLTATGFRISWSAIQNIKEYEVDVSQDGFTSFVIGYDSLVFSENQAVTTGLNAVTNYAVRVRAINSGGKSTNSNTVFVETLPAAPKAISVSTITSSSFIAEWAPVNGVTDYLIDVSKDGFNTFVQGLNENVVTGTSINVEGLLPNSTYAYRVKAFLETGNSEFSNIIRVTTLSNPPVAVTPDEISSYGARAKWDASPNVLTYELDISTDNFSSFLEGYEGKRVNGNSLLVTELIAGTAYHYRVRAVNRKGFVSDNSNMIEFTLPTVLMTLDAPTAAAATNVDLANFTANWNSPAGALFYRLEVSVDNFESILPQFARLNIYSTSINVRELEQKTEYKYRVKAFDNQGFSENSNTITVSTVKPLSLVDEMFDGVTVYPNPVSDGSLSLSVSNQSIKKFKLSLIDLNGKVIITEDFDNSGTLSLVELDLLDLSNGIYILKMTTSESSKSLKIVVNAKK
ncbi:MAG: hypothetical protein ACI9RP_000092 [Cyclobacteriaceae bacterium]|jgi:hypothetical protein